MLHLNIYIVNIVILLLYCFILLVTTHYVTTLQQFALPMCIEWILNLGITEMSYVILLIRANRQTVHEAQHKGKYATQIVNVVEC